MENKIIDQLVGDYTSKRAVHDTGAEKHYRAGLETMKGLLVDGFKDKLEKAFNEGRKPYLFSKGKTIKGYSSFEQYWDENFKDLE